MIYHARFTVKNPESVDIKELVKFLQENWWNAKTLSLKDLLYISRCLQRGESWEPEFNTLSDDIIDDIKSNTFKSDILFVQVTTEPEYHDTLVERQKKAFDLLERGAAGDAEAAIEYCRMEKAGEISRAPFA